MFERSVVKYNINDKSMEETAKSVLFLDSLKSLALLVLTRKLHTWVLAPHRLWCFCHSLRQYTSPSQITWLEDEDFFLSVLESFFLSVLQSFLSLAKEAPSKLDFDLRKENPGSLQNAFFMLRVNFNVRNLDYYTISWGNLSFVFLI